MSNFMTEMTSLIDVSRIDWAAVAATSMRILLILVLIRVMLALLRTALRRFESNLIERDRAQGALTAESTKRASTLVKLLFQGAMALIWVTGILVVLRELGVEIGPVLASAGIAGVALGFGAQNLVRDLIAGFFMLMENQVRVGDVAIVNGTGGLVEEVNLRTLVLRDVAGVKHFFPNGTITTLSNVTQEWSAYVFDIGIDYRADVDRAIEVMRRVGGELREDAQFGPLMIDAIEVFGVDNFADSSVVIKGRLRTQPIKQWEVGREYRRRLKKAFDAEGISMPFPQRTLHIAGTTEVTDAFRAERVGSRS